MTIDIVDQATPHKTPASVWIKLTIVYLFIPLILLLCGGDWGWWQAWVYALLILAAGLGSRILAEQRHPGLTEERQNAEKNQDSKTWDKALAPLMALTVSYPLVIVAGFDHRFGWSHLFPFWLIVLGFVLIALGYALGVWALVENGFFLGVMPNQLGLEQVVCDSGPYRFVRHPGYLGNILPLPGIVLALSSLWTIIPVTLALIIIVTRTALEDRTLQEELPGYKQYSLRVRYRLFPGIF
jgi:protein-S-isoprenylcysteine O-methyltransferase Ste14